MSASTTTTNPRRTARVAGVVVALAGVLLLVATIMIPEPVRDSPGMGPRVMPALISLGLLGSGLIMAWSASREGAEEGVEKALFNAEVEHDVMDLVDPDEEPVPIRGFLVVLAFMIGYALLFIPLGFILATTLFLGGVTTYADPRPWLRNWAFAAIFAVSVYFLFTKFLMVVLPPGLLG